MTKLRVLFCICEMSAGGSQRQLLSILDRLDRARFAPELFLISRHGELLGEVPADVPVHIGEHRSGGGNVLRSAMAHRRRVRSLVDVLRSRSIDVVYDRTYHMTLITGAATRRHRVPRASTIVTDPQLDFESNPERLRSLKRRMLRRAYHDADSVVAVSEGVRRAAVDYWGLAADGVETIWNGFDIESLEQRSRDELPESLARRPGRFRIVAAGRLHHQKGFDLLIEAARKLVSEHGRDQLEVIIAGVGDQEDQLRSLISQHGLADHVLLAGYQPNPLPLFRSADLFCLPSRYEGMPNALVEAMCCEVPVLAADCPSGPRDILGSQFGRLVPPDDADALANAIDGAIDEGNPSPAGVAAARQHIRDEFGLDRCVSRVEDLLARLASAEKCS